MNVNLIINPIAGHKAFRSLKCIEELLKGKVSLNTFVTQKKGDAILYAQEHATTDRIIVAGGDGTFNEVLNGVLRSREHSKHDTLCSLAFVPLGTTNVLAKELGIPEDISDAVHLALTGDPKKISPGRINGHYFVLMTGIGFDGEAVYSLKHSLKKISGKGAYILSGFRTFLKYRTPPIFVKTSEGMISGYSAVVGKSSCYGGYFKVTPKACLTEPLLDLCLLKKGGRKALFGFISRVIGNKHLDVEDVYYGKFPEIEINSNETVHVQTDGDYFGTLPVKIDVHKDAVQLVW